MATLETLNFDNLALRVLPIDPEQENYTRQVSGACFSRVKPTPLKKPETVAYAAQAMQVKNQEIATSIRMSVLQLVC